MKIVVGHLFPDYLNIYADRGNIAVLERRAAWRGHELEVRALGPGDELQAGRARPLLHRRRPGPGAGADRACPGGNGRRAEGGGRGRSRGFGRLRRIPALRALLPRPERRRAAGCGPLASPHRCRGAPDDRRRAARVRAPARATADAGGFREPCRPDVPRRGRRAARPRARRVRQRRRERLRGVPGRAGDRHVPARPAPAPQPVAGRLAARAGARPSQRRSARSWTRSRTSSRPRRTRCPPSRARVSRRPLLREPRGRRGRPLGLPASSAGGSAGSVGAARPRRARRDRTAGGRARRHPAR